MIHRGLLFWSVAAVATAIGLFTVKYKVQDLEEKIDRTNQKIIESQQATHILQDRMGSSQRGRAHRAAGAEASQARAGLASSRWSGSNSLRKSESCPPAARFTTPFPPTNGQRRPLVELARWWSRRSGGRQPLAGLRTPSRAFNRTHDAPSTGQTKSRQQRVRMATARAPPSRSTKSSRVRKGGVGEAVAKICPPEPAAAANAAAGARYGSGKERLKGDAQETARQRLVVASADLRHGLRRGGAAHGLRVAAARQRRADPAGRGARRLDPVRARRHRRPQRRGAGDLGAGDVGLRQSAPAARSRRTPRGRSSRRCPSSSTTR